MATKTQKKATTTTAPTTTTTLSPSQLGQLLNQGTGGIGTTGTTTGTTGNLPGVSTTDANDPIVFTLPHQTPIIPDLTTGATAHPDPNNGQTLTFAQFEQVGKALEASPGELKKLQAMLQSSGYITKKDYTPTGNWDTTTATAWTDFGKSLIGAPPGVSATTVLLTHKSTPNVIAEQNAIQSAINSTRTSAAKWTSTNVTLEDTNRVAQSFATAMESMGMGAPSQDVVNTFVQNFHNQQIGAAQNQVLAEKQNNLSGISNLTAAESALQSGNYAQAQGLAQGSIGGPALYAGGDAVATKAAPNLDAEALAAAKAQNPDMYYASRSADYYGILQKMLSGNLQQQTTPTNPNSLTPAGAILTTPIGQ